MTYNGLSIKEILQIIVDYGSPDWQIEKMVKFMKCFRPWIGKNMCEFMRVVDWNHINTVFNNTTNLGTKYIIKRMFYLQLLDDFCSIFESENNNDAIPEISLCFQIFKDFDTNNQIYIYVLDTFMENKLIHEFEEFYTIYYNKLNKYHKIINRKNILSDSLCIWDINIDSFDHEINDVPVFAFSSNIVKTILKYNISETFLIPNINNGFIETKLNNITSDLPTNKINININSIIDIGIKKNKPYIFIISDRTPASFFGTRNISSTVDHYIKHFTAATNDNTTIPKIIFWSLRDNKRETKILHNRNILFYITGFDMNILKYLKHNNQIPTNSIPVHLL